jgi:hypothetical protein
MSYISELNWIAQVAESQAGSLEIGSHDTSGFGVERQGFLQSLGVVRGQDLALE